jgi:hypothetical protein
MKNFAPGDDVICDFQGRQTPGEVISVYKASGYILCRIHLDPNWDYGELGPNLDPEPFVCLRADRVTIPE